MATAWAKTGSASVAKPEAPVELLVNGVKNPLAVDGDAVCFTWMSRCRRRGETQTGYQIVVASSPALVAAACQYYENLRIASRVFAVLGQTEAAHEYQRQAEEIKAGINAHLFNGEYYLVTPEKQKDMFPLASAWALRFDIVPPEAKTRVLAAIRKAGKPNIGGYGGDAFYNGLLHAGGRWAHVP
jgi:hypothetical protein